MALPRRNQSKKTNPFWWSTITIGSLGFFSRTLKQCNQNCHSIPVASGTFSQTMIQRNDQKDVMHLVSPFRSELGNEMQEMIVFLKLVYNGPFLKEVSVILKVEQKPLKVSVNENFSTLLDFVFWGFLAWVGPKFYFGRKRKSESAF